MSLVSARSVGRPTPEEVIPRLRRGSSADRGSGEHEDVLQNDGEVLGEAIGEALFANPRTPLALGNLRVAGQGLVERCQGDLAVGCDDADGS
jgi:hypothetical protein